MSAPPTVTDQDLYQLAAEVGRRARASGWRIVTAESCTAGWIAKALTDVPGSSQWVDSGYVTYSNSAKMRDIGVAERTLVEHGAVSEATVREMADGALRAAAVELAVAVTGIAGPDGGSARKPVGTVWFAVATVEEQGTAVLSEGHLFDGDREQVRRQAVDHALRLVLQRLQLAVAVTADETAAKTVPPEPSRRLFFALWPDTAMREAMTSAAREAVQAGGGRPVPAANLHVTLAFLGSLPERRLPELAEVGKAAAFESCVELTFDHLEHWRAAQLLCACPSGAPASIGGLARSLRVLLVAGGLARDPKSVTGQFRPHVTLARKVHRPPEVMEIQPVTWSSTALVLVDSKTLPGGSVYTVLERFPLGH